MKILLFANTDWFLYNFSLPLAQGLRERGDEVVLLSPPGLYSPRLVEMGFRWLSIKLERRSLDPWNEFITVIRLLRLYKRERPDLIHHFTIKCVLYGSMAGRLAGIRSIVNEITGLGYVFMEGERSRSGLRRLVKMLYRLVLRNTKVIFLNSDDEEFFLQNHLIQTDQAILIEGPGVDTDEFSPQPIPSGTPLIVLPARMLWDKGVGEFVEAARHLQASLGKEAARFALVGDNDDDNPASIHTSELKEWEKEGVVEWWGWREDMAAVYAQAAIVCLPSYREGLSKTLIEAAACGRPIIASDVPGCREVVHPGENGLLVPARDANVLANAMATLLNDPQRCNEMQRRSRQIAVEQFSVKKVVGERLEAYN
jgi:glycosyltransferase involved in cell wall biosynthesis